MTGFFARRERRANVLITIGLGLFSLVFILPLYWTAVMATRRLEEVFQFPPPVFFGDALLENFARIQAVYEPLAPLVNSLIVAVPKTIGLVLVSALAGYGFARYRRARGHRPLLVLAFATLFFPPSLALIPFFLEMNWFGWLDTFWPLIVPALASGFGVIWMYTYISGTVPHELYEASEVDGAGAFSAFFRIVLPIIRPGLAALGVWTLISTWNDFQLPLVILTDQAKFTVPLALSSLNSIYFADLPAVMLATLIGLVPVFMIFGFLSRQFISGLTGGAVKS
ncbi:carbohydrate ABC transporter permease [Inquilinus sp. Marseille-Q2685]|uniref:carbohydrate ABC transporter permease n=1 Tax=Inquilinus sp. Marseille-Q2685 TaxID=2866581 RepID=UPI001CE3CB46|nr:carbohydrate ABC transporter permease [Inquilinus sp. Marseille-Q2685]